MECGKNASLASVTVHSNRLIMEIMEKILDDDCDILPVCVKPLNRRDDSN